MLSVNQVDFLSNEKFIFHPLNISLNPGDLLQIRGPSEVGKTILLKLLAGFTDAKSGYLQYKKGIAYLGHEPGLTSWMTVKENIEMIGLLNAYKPTDVSHTIDQFYLRDQINFLPHQLSMEQKKRLAFALLSLSRAKVWLLDEPFEALDADSIALIQHLITEHLALKGMVVMTTHHEIPWSMQFRQMVVNDDHALFPAEI